MDSKIYHEMVNQIAIAKGMAEGAMKILGKIEKDGSSPINDCEAKITKTLRAIEKIQTIVTEHRKALDMDKPTQNIG